MNDLIKEMYSDINQRFSRVETMGQDGLATVSDLARQVREKTIRVQQLEEDLKEEKKSLLQLTDHELPAIMAEIGLGELKLTDGSELTLKPTYGATITGAHREAAHQWLRDHGYDDIIKSTVSCKFDRGEEERARQFSQLAATGGFETEKNETIHPQTLKAFVKERLQAGEEIPQDLFGIYAGQRATIKTPGGK